MLWHGKSNQRRDALDGETVSGGCAARFVHQHGRRQVFQRGADRLVHGALALEFTARGHAFGDCGEGFIRVSYCYSIENIKEAVTRIGEFVKELEDEHDR